MASPKISIIVPVYNVEKYIRRCLDSIAEQTFTDWECILIDDGSPDNSGAICDEYAQKDSRFVVIHKENGGVSSARNAGLDAAKGEWIGFVDADDWIEPEMYEKSVQIGIECNSDVVLFGVWDEYKNNKRTFCPKIINKHGVLRNFIRYPNYFNYPVNKLFKKYLINKYNVRFPLDIKICEDLFFNFSFFLYANSFIQIKESFYHYNHCNELSTMNNYTFKYFEDKCWVTDHIEKLLIENKEEGNNKTIIMFYKLYAKLVLILYPKIRNSTLWKKTYPEANNYIWRVPLRLDYKIFSQLCAWGLFKIAYFLQDLKKGKW